MIEAHSTAEFEIVPWERVRKLQRPSEADDTAWIVVEQDALFDVELEGFYGTSGSAFVWVSGVVGALRSLVGHFPSAEDGPTTWVEPPIVGTGNTIVIPDLIECVTSHLEAIGGVLPAWPLSPIGYSLRNPLEVYSFLSKNPALMPLLVRGAECIREYFPHAELILEFMADPEVPGAEQLLILIQTDFSVDEALDRLDLVDEDWWFGASHQAYGKLCVDVEFA